LSVLLVAACAGEPAPPPPVSSAPAPAAATPVTYGTERVGSTTVFFREAGPPDAPVLLLLHGFPSSSHQYRALIDELAAELHVVAPDYPGFGFSEAPAHFEYTFDRLAEVIEAFCVQRGLTSFFVYMFDFGAPVGFRLALRHPQWIAGIVTQNGNAHEQSIAPDIAAMIRLDARTAPDEAEQSRRGALTLQATKAQYLDGAAHPERIAPEAWLLDQHFLDRPERALAMLSLMDDYKTNVAAYPTWQRFLRERHPPTLIVWGKNDPIFLEVGAHAWKRDVPDAELHLLDGGHFALEEHAATVAALIRRFVRQASAGRR
jgi:pimeloyl-ACP methyl ester carboxylesterase